ncbi:hypothetical protein CGC56_10115 [Capnocytophaga canimorsus]|uniref:Uncharacterized protein n=1 Tax=Capnocytophaga canimorsus TaxID=28188 RepID=A0A250G513_9FLAO|nr:hypothetical protein [Capnocytophaga canimorsus]ATA92482.1 hypothetical protein CGC56_10115 [Capnocytophaga canimorsus]
MKSIKILILSVLGVLTFKTMKAQKNYGEYIEPYNINLMAQVMASKENLYKHHYQLIDKKVEKIEEIILLIKKFEYTESQVKYMETFYDNLEKIYGWDLSDRNTVHNIFQWLNKVEEKVVGWGKAIVEKEEAKNKQQAEGEFSIKDLRKVIAIVEFKPAKKLKPHGIEKFNLFLNYIENDPSFVKQLNINSWGVCEYYKIDNFELYNYYYKRITREIYERYCRELNALMLLDGVIEQLK